MKAGGLLQSLEKYITLFGKRLVTFISVQQSKFPSITKKKHNILFQDAPFAVDAAKQSYKIIWSENNFNRFCDKTVTTAEEYKLTLQNCLII